MTHLANDRVAMVTVSGEVGVLTADDTNGRGFADAANTDAIESLDNSPVLVRPLTRAGDGGERLSSTKSGVTGRLRAARSSASSASTGRRASRNSSTSRKARSSERSPPTTRWRLSPSWAGSGC